MIRNRETTVGIISYSLRTEMRMNPHQESPHIIDIPIMFHEPIWTRIILSIIFYY